MGVRVSPPPQARTAVPSACDSGIGTAPPPVPAWAAPCPSPGHGALPTAAPPRRHRSPRRSSRDARGGSNDTPGRRRSVPRRHGDRQPAAPRTRRGHTLDHFRARGAQCARHFRPRSAAAHVQAGCVHARKDLCAGGPVRAQVSGDRGALGRGGDPGGRGLSGGCAESPGREPQAGAASPRRASSPPCRTCSRTCTTAGRWTRLSCRRKTAWWSFGSDTTGTPRA